MENNIMQNENKPDMNVNSIVDGMQFLTLGVPNIVDQRKFNVNAWSTPLKSIENVRNRTDISALQALRRHSYFKFKSQSPNDEATPRDISVEQITECDSDSLNNISDLLPIENIFEKTSELIELCLTFPEKAADDDLQDGRTKLPDETRSLIAGKVSCLPSPLKSIDQELNSSSNDVQYSKQHLDCSRLSAGGSEYNDRRNSECCLQRVPSIVKNMASSLEKESFNDTNFISGPELFDQSAKELPSHFVSTSRQNHEARNPNIGELCVKSPKSLSVQFYDQKDVDPANSLRLSDDPIDCSHSDEILTSQLQSSCIGKNPWNFSESSADAETHFRNSQVESLLNSQEESLAESVVDVNSVLNLTNFDSTNDYFKNKSADSYAQHSSLVYGKSSESQNLSDCEKKSSLTSESNVSTSSTDLKPPTRLGENSGNVDLQFDFVLNGNVLTECSSGLVLQNNNETTSKICDSETNLLWSIKSKINLLHTSSISPNEAEGDVSSASEQLFSKSENADLGKNEPPSCVEATRILEHDIPNSFLVESSSLESEKLESFKNESYCCAEVSLISKEEIIDLFPNVSTFVKPEELESPEKKSGPLSIEFSSLGPEEIKSFKNESSCCAEISSGAIEEIIDMPMKISTSLETETLKFPDSAQLFGEFFKNVSGGCAEVSPGSMEEVTTSLESEEFNSPEKELVVPLSIKFSSLAPDEVESFKNGSSSGSTESVIDASPHVSTSLESAALGSPELARLFGEFSSLESEKVESLKNESGCCAEVSPGSMGEIIETPSNLSTSLEFEEPKSPEKESAKLSIEFSPLAPEKMEYFKNKSSYCAEVLWASMEATIDAPLNFSTSLECEELKSPENKPGGLSNDFSSLESGGAESFKHESIACVGAKSMSEGRSSNAFLSSSASKKHEKADSPEQASVRCMELKLDSEDVLNACACVTPFLESKNAYSSEKASSWCNEAKQIPEHHISIDFSSVSSSVKHVEVDSLKRDLMRSMDVNQISEPVDLSVLPSIRCDETDTVKNESALRMHVIHISLDDISDVPNVLPYVEREQTCCLEDSTECGVEVKQITELNISNSYLSDFSRLKDEEAYGREDARELRPDISSTSSNESPPSKHKEDISSKIAPKLSMKIDEKPEQDGSDAPSSVFSSIESEESDCMKNSLMWCMGGKQISNAVISNILSNDSLSSGTDDSKEVSTWCEEEKRIPSRDISNNFSIVSEVYGVEATTSPPHPSMKGRVRLLSRNSYSLPGSVHHSCEQSPNNLTYFGKVDCDTETIGSQFSNLGIDTSLSSKHLGSVDHSESECILENCEKKSRDDELTIIVESKSVLEPTVGKSGLFGNDKIYHNSAVKTLQIFKSVVASENSSVSSLDDVDANDFPPIEEAVAQVPKGCSTNLVKSYDVKNSICAGPIPDLNGSDSSRNSFATSATETSLAIVECEKANSTFLYSLDAEKSLCVPLDNSTTHLGSSGDTIDSTEEAFDAADKCKPNSPKIESFCENPTIVSWNKNLANVSMSNNIVAVTHCSVVDVEGCSSVISDGCYQNCAESPPQSSVAPATARNLGAKQRCESPSSKSSDGEHIFVCTCSDLDPQADEYQVFDDVESEKDIRSNDVTPEASTIISAFRSESCIRDAGRSSAENLCSSSDPPHDCSSGMVTAENVKTSLIIRSSPPRIVDTVLNDSVKTPTQLEQSISTFQTPVRKTDQPLGKDLQSAKVARVCDSISKLMWLCTPMKGAKAQSHAPMQPFRCETTGNDGQKIVFDFPTNLLDVSISMLESMTAMIKPAEVVDSKLRDAEQNVASDLVSIARTPSLDRCRSEISESSISDVGEAERPSASTINTRLLEENAHLKSELEECNNRYCYLQTEFDSLLNTTRALRANETALMEALHKYEDETRKVNNKYEILKEYANDLIIELNRSLDRCESELRNKTKELEDLRAAK